MKRKEGGEGGGGRERGGTNRKKELEERKEGGRGRTSSEGCPHTRSLLSISGTIAGGLANIGTFSLHFRPCLPLLARGCFPRSYCLTAPTQAVCALRAESLPLSHETLTRSRPHIRHAPRSAWCCDFHSPGGETGFTNTGKDGVPTAHMCSAHSRFRL